MKILQINKSDRSGGAAIAAHRLHDGLLTAGINSSMLVEQKTGGIPKVIGPTRAGAKIAAQLRYPLARELMRYRTGRRTGNFSPAWLSSRLDGEIDAFGPDIIHLHYICREFLRPEQLRQFGVPIVWTLHDMWPFTGGCNYDENCGRYEAQCGRCPMIGSRRDDDLSRKLWNRKKAVYADINLTIVVLSKWMERCVRKSSLFADKPVVVIPNGLDTDLFRPIEQDLARSILRLPRDRKLILFGSISPTSNPRKGFQYLRPALETLSGRMRNVDLVLFGGERPESPPDFGFPAHYAGRLHDTVSLVLLYSAADVFVAPSVQDNLPNTVMESLACGTPCAAYAIGGMPDMIQHRVNGILSEPFDAESLADGIQWLLEKDDRYLQMRKNARQKAISQYSRQQQAKEMIHLYQRLKDGQKRCAG